jgi:xanthine dehydrogenase accessory factor
MDAKALIPLPGGATDALSAAVECARRGVRGALATVLGRHGSTPSTPGQKLFAGADGTCVGTVGGGAVEREVLDCLETILASDDGRRETRTFQLGAELGMCCGGQVEVFLEPIEAVVPCLIVGGGHVATALAPLLARLGFSVTVVDAREEWGKSGRLEGVRCVVGEFDDPECGLDPATAPGTAVLVMTHDHALDQQVLEGALTRGAGFVGGVGSRAKAKRTRDRLEAKGFREADLLRIRMPLGVDIGARLPDEIAVAIAAEMVAWRRKRSGRPGT